MPSRRRVFGFCRQISLTPLGKSSRKKKKSKRQAGKVNPSFGTAFGCLALRPSGFDKRPRVRRVVFANELARVKPAFGRLVSMSETVLLSGTPYIRVSQGADKRSKEPKVETSNLGLAPLCGGAEHSTWQRPRRTRLGNRP